MFHNGYVGTGEDAKRIRRQEKQREEQKKKFEALQKQTNDRIESAGLRQFDASATEALDHAFKNETVGLVTKDEFVKKRLTLQERLEEDARRKAREEEQNVLLEKERRKKEKQSNKPKLSFVADDEEEQDNEDNPLAAQPVIEDGPAQKKAKFGKLGKDPTVATEFLPDRDRERLEEELRAQLKREYQAQQEKVKQEPLEITFSYWDGRGHRRKALVKKGDSIGAFLKAALAQLVPDFRELRHVSAENMMYIKEDLIIPHHHTFYDLIVNKARGKSGPLFDFDVHEDIRLIHDATQEKNDSHAGKVVERHWYEKNKHIFPANRWEAYDPDKTYDTYTIYGK